jgi:hypothetical protein
MEVKWSEGQTLHRYSDIDRAKFAVFFLVFLSERTLDNLFFI